MAQITPQYEELDEFVSIANKLIERHPAIFAGISVDKIACVAITNKDRKEGKPRWELKTVVPPVSIFCPKEYIVVLFLSDWAALSQKQKGYLVAQALRSISPEGEGKTIPFDMKDHAIMLRTFGVDYIENPSVPDLLTADISWRN